MIHQEPDDIKWADSLDDFKAEGYTAVKVWSLLQFYILKGRTTTLAKANLEPIRYLYYTLYDPNVKRYYKRLFRPLPVEVLLPNITRTNFDYIGDDELALSLRRYSEDGNLTILYTPEQLSEVIGLLERLWKAYFNVEGKLDYRIYIQILDLSLKLEEFKEYQKNITGYKTVINQIETQIRDLWAKANAPKQ